MALGEEAAEAAIDTAMQGFAMALREKATGDARGADAAASAKGKAVLAVLQRADRSADRSERLARLESAASATADVVAVAFDAPAGPAPAAAAPPRRL